MTQDAADEATQSLRLTLPGFSVGPEVLSWPACPASAVTSDACPATSRLGAAASSTGFGDFTGDAFYGGRSGESPRVLVSCTTR